MAESRKRRGRPRLGWTVLVLAVLMASAGALTVAYAQSDGGWSLKLNSPVSFPVDI